MNFGFVAALPFAIFACQRQQYLPVSLFVPAEGAERIQPIQKINCCLINYPE